MKHQKDHLRELLKKTNEQLRIYRELVVTHMEEYQLFTGSMATVLKEITACNNILGGTQPVINPGQN